MKYDKRRHVQHPKSQVQLIEQLPVSLHKFHVALPPTTVEMREAGLEPILVIAHYFFGRRTYDRFAHTSYMCIACFLLVTVFIHVDTKKDGVNIEDENREKSEISVRRIRTGARETIPSQCNPRIEFCCLNLQDEKYVILSIPHPDKHQRSFTLFIRRIRRRHFDTAFKILPSPFQIDRSFPLQ